MWTRIYLIALAVFLLPMAFLTYYSWDWLRSIGSPQAAIEGYSYYSNLSWILLWFSSEYLLLRLFMKSNSERIQIYVDTS